MPEDNVQMNGVGYGRWTVFALLLILGVAGYFLFSPRVAPIVRPSAVQETP